MANSAIESVPWWQSLPTNFRKQHHQTPMDVAHPIKVAASAATDYALRTGLATAVCGAMLPTLGPKGIAREKSLAEFYKHHATQGDQTSIFLDPPTDVAIKKTRKHIAELADLGAGIEQLAFDSPYQALHPDIRDEYAERHANKCVQAQHWRHPNGPRRTLIFVHGYSLDAYWINSQMFSLRWFFRQGWDIVLFTLPFHGRRKARWEPFSGFGFFSRGFAHMNEAMLQSIYELRILLNYLFAQGVPDVGISGLSLGGYLSALLAAVDDRLAFSIPNAAVVSPADMILEWPPISTLVSPVLPRLGLSIHDLRHMMAVHSPLTWQPKLSSDRLLIIAGAGDRFTAPRYQHLLHQHWIGCQLHWFPGNHVVHLHQREYLRVMRDFMSRSSTQSLSTTESIS